MFDGINPWLAVGIGAALLLAGRQLFWLFVALIGFIAGHYFGPAFFPDAPRQALLLIALGSGVFGMVLAIAIQKVAVVVAGGLAGGYGALELWTRLSAASDLSMWVAFAAGAIVGAIVMTMVFKWALVVLSAVGGAGLITWVLPLEGAVEAAVFVALALAGIIFQARALVARE